MKSRKQSLCLILCVVLFPLTFAGCFKPTSPPKIITEMRSVEEVIPLAQYRIAGTSLKGQTIMYQLLGQGEDTIFILSTIHGDEPAGTALIHRLAEHLQNQPNILQGRKVILLPVANPDGKVLHTRYNANGVDLNRNFPTQNRINNETSGRTALSEPETCAIEQIIQQYNPDRILSLHQVVGTGPEGLANLLPGGCFDYDEPGQELAEHIAKYCNLAIHKLGAKSGSLGSYAGLTLEIPIVTIELPYQADQLEQNLLWQRFSKALLAAITFPAAPE